MQSSSHKRSRGNIKTMSKVVSSLIKDAEEEASVYYKLGEFANGSMLLKRDDILAWLERILSDAPGQLEKVADLTSFDPSDRMFRYNCLDAAFGFQKNEKQTPEGHGGQPGQFAGLMKRKHVMWSCPLFTSLLAEDLKQLDLKATIMDTGSDPSTCDGRVMYFMVTDQHKTAKRGDFHLLFLAQHVLFNVNRRIVRTIHRSIHRKNIHVNDIRKYFQCKSCEVFQFDSGNNNASSLPSDYTLPLASDYTLPLGSTVLVKNVWVWVHKRGTATPWLIHDAKNNVMHVNDDLLDPNRFDYPEMRYGKVCHQRPVCISRIRPIDVSASIQAKI
jgi:hypothetical protein